MNMDSVGPETLAKVARATFGQDARIARAREITPSVCHGITETPPSTRNLLFRVDLEGDSCPYVFRFSRGEQDVYEQEAENYRLLAASTGVNVPGIYRIDASRRLVPTSYMVMDYLPGKPWLYLAHPNNPCTTPAEKQEIAGLIGEFYRNAHATVCKAEYAGTEAQTLLYSMDLLEEAARKGVIDISVGEIDACRSAILNEPAFGQSMLSLCLADIEVHLLKQAGAWEIAFVCDAEWVAFRHPFWDLTQMLGGAQPWWDVDVPALCLDPEVVASMPFFRAYDPGRRLDYDELLRISCTYQLSLWAYVAMASRSSEKQTWIKQAKEPLIQELVRIVSARALALSA